MVVRVVRRVCAAVVVCRCAHLNTEEHVDRGELRVALKRGEAELDARDAAEEEQPDVEEERVHHRRVDLHRVDWDPEEA